MADPTPGLTRNDDLLNLRPAQEQWRGEFRPMHLMGRSCLPTRQKYQTVSNSKLSAWARMRLGQSQAFGRAGFPGLFYCSSEATSLLPQRHGPIAHGSRGKSVNKNNDCSRDFGRVGA